jgi:hypothetical protein
MKLNNNNEKRTGIKIANTIILIILFSALFSLNSIIKSNAAPGGVEISFNTSEKAAALAGYSINTSGGTFTTMMMNATSLNERWKAYIGNITGKLTLRNTLNNTIYDWVTNAVSGEIYASRSNDLGWATIQCAGATTIQNEQTALNITNSKTDSINHTFGNLIHRGFYAGSSQVINSTCKSTATYVNNAEQTIDEDAKFQEILLEDSDNDLIYATLINNATQGFDSSFYDFQMILAENAIPSNPAETYYFYAELI